MPLTKDLTKFTTTSQTLASYSSEEIASGLLFVTNYLTVTKDNAGTQYTLTTDSGVYSSIIETTRTTDGTTTLTFDSAPFNLTRTIKGTALANIGNQANSVLSGEEYTIQIQKWDGSSATNISSVITTERDATAATVSANQIPCTETVIAEGEQLRIVIGVVVVQAGVQKMTVGHDPRNRDGIILQPSSEDTITSSFIKIPFKRNS
tara:strand:- start:1046 stop:1663 length:618 start_codon:yes stop_codon:yes gene_type:complete